GNDSHQPPSEWDAQRSTAMVWLDTRSWFEDEDISARNPDNDFADDDEDDDDLDDEDDDLDDEDDDDFDDDDLDDDEDDESADDEDD
ncbi:MAG TPA: hypothetical protein VMS64_27925, partial [Candidatus Methylomirabilis sp.]|nr:hypothetical protein [Candidatus Methylomirabilis sp.]